MRTGLGFILFATMATVLSGCQQSGRPDASAKAAPASVAATPPAFGQVVDGYYIVAPGDSLSVIAKRTNTPLRTLIDSNNLKPPYIIQSGQKLSLNPRRDYEVKPGDTVSEIAQREHVSPSALIQLNNLAAPYKLQVGQHLILPSDRDVPSAQPASQPTLAAAPALAQTTTNASSADATSKSAIAAGSLQPLPGAKAGAPTSLAPVSSSNVQQKPNPIGANSTAAPSKPTMKPVAEVEEPEIIDLPEPPSAPPVKAPEKVTLEAQKPSQPSVPQVQAPEVKTPEVKAPELSLPEPPTSDVPPASKIDAGKAATQSPELAAAPAVPALPQIEEKAGTAPVKGFIWPVNGKVVSRFGTTADGLRNDGINIAAPSGAPVKAAADGIVAYAGSELRGFGNMILIKHADNWVTAYAHNSSLLVKKGDKIKQGTIIARVGSSGNVADPQLHFEIRNGTKPIDPLSKLSR